jgi:hypothetical protein
MISLVLVTDYSFALMAKAKSRPATAAAVASTTVRVLRTWSRISRMV